MKDDAPLKTPGPAPTPAPAPAPPGPSPMRRLLDLLTGGRKRTEPGEHVEFDAAFKAERDAIRERRKHAYRGDPEAAGGDPADDLVGLSLSGGGVRSATFNLGLIQALHKGGVLKHVDYLATISGGGYIGSSLARRAAQAADKLKAAPDEARADPDWFPFPTYPGGRQGDRVKKLYRGGRSLDRSDQLAWVWLPGTILNLLMLASLLVAVAAFAAWLLRLFDEPRIEHEVSDRLRRGLYGLSRFGHALAGDVETWRKVVPTIVLVGLGLLVPLLLKIAGDAVESHRRRVEAPEDDGPRQGGLDETLRRLGRVLLWPMLVFSALASYILWLDWPTRAEVDRGTATARASGRMPEIVAALDLKARLDEAGRPEPREARERNDLSTRAGLLVELLSGDPRRVRGALPQVDKLSGDRLPWRQRVLDDLDGTHWFDDLRRAAGFGSGDESAALVATTRPGSRDAAPLPYDRATDRQVLAYASWRIPETLGLVRSAAAQAPGRFALDPAVGEPDPEAIQERLRDELNRSRATELTYLIHADLTRALLPALLCLLVYGVVASYQYIRLGITRTVGRKPNDSRARLVRWCWLLLGLGILLTMTNGDTDIGFLKHVLPSVPGVEPLIDPTTNAVSGARVTLGGTLEMVRNLVFTVPTALTALLALVPILSRTAFIRSAELPKSTVSHRFFSLVIGLVVTVIPLAAFAFLARENVSGAAPLKAADTAAAAGSTQPRQVARMAYCPDSPFLDRAYLVQNDQLARLMALAAGGLLFAFLAVVVDLNRTSIHTFYRDRLYETYLADRPRERRKKIRLSEQDGTLVGFPLHLISTTLNQFRHPDDPRPSQHNFVFSRLYCGSEPTGYRRTAKYADGVDLADAVAVSGAAISPVQGQSLVTRIVMLVLNMRLGQWYPNPRPEDAPANRNDRANLARLLPENLSPFKGLRGWFRRRVLRRPGPSEELEHRSFCFLSDGAHYDNLGIKMLLERRCRLILVSDVSHDPAYSCDELAGVFRQTSAYQGITFTPIPMATVREALGLPKADIHAEPDLRLDPFHFRTDTDDEARKKLKARLARENFLVGRVDYHPEHVGGPLRRGLLVLIKPTLTLELADQVALIRHFLDHTDFPHDSDMDQFYDEARVEAYRQLGECVGGVFARGMRGPGADGNSRADLMGAVARLCGEVPDQSRDRVTKRDREAVDSQVASASGALRWSRLEDLVEQARDPRLAAINPRRHELIDKKYRGESLSPAERAELDRLQDEAEQIVASLFQAQVRESAAGSKS